MEENVLDQHLSNSLTITPEITNYLREGAKWGKFLSIMGFIFAGLIMIVAIVMGFMLGTIASGFTDELASNGLASIGGGFIGLFYFLIGLLYFMPSLYLYRHSKQMKLALEQKGQQLLSDSFKNYKSLYKFWGIFMLVIIGFYVLMFIIIVFTGAAGFMF